MNDDSESDDSALAELPGSKLPPHGHEPVLVAACIDALRLSSGSSRRRVFVDCTTGRGGHSLKMASLLAASDTLVCLDADAANLAYAKDRIASSNPACTVHCVNENFTQVGRVLRHLKIAAADGILADLGLSTNQILAGTTGLSFHADDPLDMRIDSRTALTASHIVNKWREEDIANLIYELADERYSRRIARKIIEARAVTPIATSRRLAEIVRSAVPHVHKRAGRGAARVGRKSGRSTESIDPATRTFLALRMKVNRESENLRDLLTLAPSILHPEGVLAVISFQSTEDRIVKHTLIELSQQGLLEIVTRKPVGPSEAEISDNPRSRSAKLRVAKRPLPP
jgi:16S rRNA (cytosine1402-N4)-methyltransferase